MLPFFSDLFSEKNAMFDFPFGIIKQRGKMLPIFLPNLFCFNAIFLGGSIEGPLFWEIFGVQCNFENMIYKEGKMLPIFSSELFLVFNAIFLYGV